MKEYGSIDIYEVFEYDSYIRMVGYNMAARVYTFYITYEGLEKYIWRKIEVSSNYRLDQLGYMVLAAFDTLAYHLFSFDYEHKLFQIPNEDSFHEQFDMAAFQLYQLDMQVGDRIQMNYDFGTPQTFWLELIAIENMKRGWGGHYPFILDGAGRGIIDDLNCGDLKELVEQIDRNGKTDHPIYYADRRVSWDYRKFDLKCINRLLKFEIDRIEDAYAPYWNM